MKRKRIFRLIMFLIRCIACLLTGGECPKMKEMEESRKRRQE